MRGRDYEYVPLMAAATLFVFGLFAFFALPSLYRAGAVLVLAVSGAMILTRVINRRPTPLPQDRPQGEEIELRTLDKVRDANLVSRDDYESRNDEILGRDRIQ